jgi:RNA polymerase sigma factor (sigma-70 family)
MDEQMPQEDGEVMRRVASGEIGLVEVLFERHHAALFRFFRRLFGRAAAAEDLVQETFLRILKYRRSFRPGGSFKAWLFAVARSAAKEQFRREARGQAPETAIRERIDPTPLPLDRMETAEKLERLEEAIARLSADDREALLLARYEGLSHGELATVLDCSVGAARVRVHRALSRLRAQCVQPMEVNRAL